MKEYVISSKAKDVAHKHQDLWMSNSKQFQGEHCRLPSSFSFEIFAFCTFSYFQVLDSWHRKSKAPKLKCCIFLTAISS